MVIELSEEERSALMAVLATLQRKAARGEWWMERMRPLAGFVERVRGGR